MWQKELSYEFGRGSHVASLGAREAGRMLVLAELFGVVSIYCMWCVQACGKEGKGVKSQALN